MINEATVADTCYIPSHMLGRRALPLPQGGLLLPKKQAMEVNLGWARFQRYLALLWPPTSQVRSLYEGRNIHKITQQAAISASPAQLSNQCLRPHPHSTYSAPPSPSTHPALTHQTPGNGKGSTDTPTCLVTHKAAISDTQLSELRPRAGARPRLGDYPQKL